ADRQECRREAEGADANAFRRQGCLDPDERRRDDQEEARRRQRDLRLRRRAAWLPLRRTRELPRRERQGGLGARRGLSQETLEKVSCARADAACLLALRNHRRGRTSGVRPRQWVQACADWVALGATRIGKLTPVPPRPQ